jgi:hypothetical protein
MLIRADIAGDAADLRADGCGVAIAPGIAAGAEPGLPQQLIDPAGRQAEALAQHVQPVLVIKAEQHPAQIHQQHLGATAIHGSTIAAPEAGSPAGPGRGRDDRGPEPGLAAPECHVGAASNASPAGHDRRHIGGNVRDHRTQRM